MAVTDQPARSPVTADRSPRRRWVGAVIAVLVLVVAGATAVTARRLDHRYGPIQPGPFGGPYTQHNWVFSRDGFSERLSPEAEATAKYLSGISNVGSHAVTVSSIDTTDVVTAVSWSTYHVRAGGYATGVRTRWRAFPATVPAHGTIRLLLTIRHPDCAAYRTRQGHESAVVDSILEVHWKSLLHDHTTATDPFSDTHVGVC